MPAPEYDIFLSHAWADGDRPRQIADALRDAGLRVWFDANEINDFESITHAVNTGLAKVKALLAYFSKTYPIRRACQWELTAAFLAGEAEGDARRRVLVVNPEPTSAHIHPVQLRDAKFRPAPQTDSDLAGLANAVITHLKGIDGPLANIKSLSAPQWYLLNPVGSTRFTGRIEKMWELHSALSAGDVAQVTGAAAATGGIAQVQGLAGVGKSLLAEEYALRFGSAYPGGIFWLRAYGNESTSTAGDEGREAQRAAQIRQIAERLGLSLRALTIDQIEGVLGRELAKIGKPCLWVVDDVPNGLDAQMLRRWFAPNPIARTLITTRSRAYGAFARAVDLSVLHPDEAFHLLTSQRKPTNKSEEEHAQALASDLGYHSLAIDVAAASLKSYDNEPFKTFRKELAHEDQDALELAVQLADALPNGHEPSIGRTVLRSIRVLGSEGKDLLRLASVLAVAPISASLVTAVFDATGTPEAEWAQRKAFQQLTQASLVETAGEDARMVHTLVSRTMRFDEKSAPERIGTLRIVAIRVLTSRISSIPHIGEYGKIAMDIPHARRLVVDVSNDAEQATLADWVARWDYGQANYKSAQHLEEQALNVRRRVLGKKHPDTLTLMNNLALTLLAQGDHRAARKLQEQVLDLRQCVHGKKHPNTLTAMNNLAKTLSLQGENGAARKLQEKVLKVSQRALGEEHPDTLTAMSNLALTLLAQGNYAAARKLQDPALESRQRVLGEEHPDTLAAMLNLAMTLQAQGDYAAARRLQEKVLNAFGRILGAEHPDTLIAMNNLAKALLSQGEFTAARALSEQALSAFRRVLGEEHPDTLTAMLNLAQTLRAQGDHSVARTLQAQVLEISRQVLGEEHPNTLAAMNNLAQTLYEQGDHGAARTLQEQVLKVLARVLGKEHPDTLTAMNNLAQTLQAQSDYAAARKMQEEVLDARRRVLGKKHPDTMAAMLNLAGTLSLQGDHAAARKFQKEALEARQEILGEEHPDMLIAMNNLAFTLQAQGDYPAARTLQEKVLKAFRRVVGEEHPNTLTAKNNLALTLQTQGDQEAARKLQEQVLEVLRRVLGERHPGTLPAMLNLAQTLRAQGDHAAALKLQEQILEVSEAINQISVDPNAAPEEMSG